MRYLLFLTGLLLAQNAFEGTVVYAARFEGEMAKQLGDMLRASLPERFVLYYRGDKVRMDMGETILLADYSAKKAYILNPSLQTYTEQSIEGQNKSDENKPEVKKTKEKTKILGYVAEKYEATVASEQGPVKLEIWATFQLKGPQHGKNPLASGVEIQGFPLKIVSQVSGIDLKIVFLATEISQRPLSEDLFQIPAGYVKEESEEVPQD
jgi:hypothetical protein